MKRFYETVQVSESEDGFEITLDGKPVKTPARRNLHLPNRALAEDVADEWRAQQGDIDAAAMGLTRLANSAIDTVRRRRHEVMVEIAAFAGSDLICYRAGGPADLVDRQMECWQPLVEWAKTRYGAALLVTTGVAPLQQKAEALAAIAAAVAEFQDFPLTALHAVTAACGSVVIALALAEERLDAQAACRAAHLDEEFQIGRWGEDAEQQKALEAVRRDIEVAGRMLRLTRPG